MSEVPACEVCGGKSFHKVSGFYVCTNCDTQSQEVQVQLFDYSINAKGNDEEEEREEIRTQKIEKDRDLTSWEMYNISLKRMIEQLISLGAPPELKIVAFQIWATCLQKSNVAFFSKNKDKLPPLPLGFKSRDAQILYGVPNLRKQLFNDIKYYKKIPKAKRPRADAELDNQSTSSSSAESVVSLKSLRKKQRKLALTELNESSLKNESALSYDDSLQTLISEKLKKAKKHKIISFKTTGQDVLKGMIIAAQKAKNLNVKDPLYKKVQSVIDKRLNNPRNKAEAISDFVVTFGTAVTVIRIALLLLGSGIQLGDLMRWFGEGHLSYGVNDPDAKSSENDEIPNPLCSKTGFQVDMKNFTKALGFSCIPSPDLYKLVERYCTELCLPREFVSYVHGAMNLLPPEMNYEQYSYRVVPDYECRALAYILFAFKLLFSLDGITERKQSEFADYVNESRSTNSELPLLFSWNAWVQYIQCRKAILSKYDPIINNWAYRGRIDNKDAYINQWDKLKRPLSVRSFHMNKVFCSTTSEFLRKTIRNDDWRDIKFPASLTPQSTGVTHLLNNYSYVIENDARSILENKFTDYSIQHLLNSDRCNEIAAECNATVEFIEGIAQVDARFYTTDEDVGLFEMYKTQTVPAYAPTRVEIVEDKPNTKKRKPQLIDHKCKTFKYTYETFIDHQPPPKTKTFKIYTPAREYWFFHEFGRKMSNEKYLNLTEENLSESFNWLIKELANMAYSESKDIFTELVNIESGLYTLFENDADEYAEKCPFRMYPYEW